MEFRFQALVGVIIESWEVNTILEWNIRIGRLNPFSETQCYGMNYNYQFDVCNFKEFLAIALVVGEYGPVFTWFDYLF